MKVRKSISWLRRNKKKVLVGLVIIVILDVYVYKEYRINKSIPDYDAKVEIAGLKKQVKVLWDENGIPHIYAQSEEDLARATGYVHAKSRLAQMIFLRRVTQGRLSEFSGEDAVNDDLFLRTLGIEEKSREVIKRTDDHLLKLLQAYADGVNQFIEEADREGKLPVEFNIYPAPEKWKIEHSLNLIGYMAWSLSSAWKIDVVFQQIQQKVNNDKMYRELIPNADMLLYKNTIYPSTSEFTELIDEFLESSLLNSNERLSGRKITSIFDASNTWAVSGKKSATGKPILANDMHLNLNVPNIWYQMHQVVEGEDGYDVTGVALTSTPFVVAGRNKHISWGMTNFMSDNIDFYWIKINPENPKEYLYNNEWVKFKIIKEKIKIKGGKVVEKEIRLTKFGPIISQFKGITDKAVVMRWVGNEPGGNEVLGLYLLNKAKNWEDFREAMKEFGAVSLSISYADVEGNIGMHSTGHLPIREKGNGLGILPGWTDEYEWAGMIPFEEMPYVFNPPEGFVASANNRIADKYTYDTGLLFETNWRIDGIIGWLQSKEELSVDDFKAMQNDQKSLLAEYVKKDIITVLEKTNLNEIESEAFAYFKKWNCIMNKDSIAAAIFGIFYYKFIQNTFQDDMGKLFNDYMKSKMPPHHAFINVWHNRDSLWYDISTTPSKETFEDIIQKSFKDSIALLSEKLGDSIDDWRWGKIHKVKLVHPLGTVKALDLAFNFNRGPYEIGGNWDTINASRWDFGAPKYKFNFDTFNFAEFANYGASQRSIYSLKDGDQSVSIMPMGNSGAVGDKYYDNQNKLYLNGGYNQDYYSEEIVKEKAIHKMTLSESVKYFV